MIKFNFGRKETTVWQYALIAIVLDLIVTFAVRFGSDRREIIRLVDRFVRENNLDRVNDFIIRDDEWLDVRVEGDITQAIEEYQLTEDPTPVTITEYTYSEKPSDGSLAQELLGGEMRLTADFYKEDNEL